MLDTHVWIWWLTAQSPLSKAERAALDEEAAQGGIFLSPISMWEARVLHAKQRLQLDVPFAIWIREAASDALLTILPMDVHVILALDNLPASIHGDPADRLIIATAIAHGLPLATRDAAIRKSRALKLWRPGKSLAHA
ncbi:MAG: type II toxin-antitoxin system VapC family toxin [Betaproteobacteria bacterium]